MAAYTVVFPWDAETGLVGILVTDPAIAGSGHRVDVLLTSPSDQDDRCQQVAQEVVGNVQAATG